MPVPTTIGAQAYLAPLEMSWAVEDIEDAFTAEKSAQAARCKVPAVDAADWPADLVEALYRRVAHNLALRALPLGIQANISEMGVATNRVGGLDAEVTRLEAPYRKWVVG